MLRYLRAQAATHSQNFAQAMLDHGAFTFVPNAPEGLPVQRPKHAFWPRLMITGQLGSPSRT